MFRCFTERERGGNRVRVTAARFVGRQRDIIDVRFRLEFLELFRIDRIRIDADPFEHRDIDSQPLDIFSPDHDREAGPHEAASAALANLVAPAGEIGEALAGQFGLGPERVMHPDQRA